MELREYIQLIRKNILLIIIVSVVFGVVGYVWSSSRAPSYSATIDLYISKDHEVSQSGDYSYDGYYAQQVAEKYADTVVGLIESTDVIVSSLDRAGIDSSGDIQKYERALNVQKPAPQIVTVQVVLKDADQASKLVLAISEEAQSRVSSLSTLGEEGLILSAMNEEPFTDSDRFPEGLAGLLGLVVGAGLIKGWIFLQEYLK